MADAVSTNIAFNGLRKYVAKFTNVSDGTGESDVTKIDISTLATANGTAPASLALMNIVYDVQGFTNVVLEWDRTAADYPIAVMSGQGVYSYESVGGLLDPGKAAAGTGDIILSTTGGESGSTYDITVEFKLRD